MSGFKTAIKLATVSTVGAMTALVLTSEAFADDTKYGPAGSAVSYTHLTLPTILLV